MPQVFLLIALAAVQVSDIPPVVRKAAHDNAVVVRSGNSMGSGCYLGDGLYLTAAHVVQGARSATVTYANGKTYTCQVVKIDPAYDQALLESAVKTGGGVPLATSNASLGDTVYFAGYSRRRLEIWGARAASTSRPVNGRTLDWVSSQGKEAAIPGDSGGPVFNAKGELVGNLWGSDYPQTRTKTTSVNAGRTQRFLGNTCVGRIRQWLRGGGGRCQPGLPCPPQGGQGGIGGDIRYGEGGREPILVPPGIAVPEEEPIVQPQPQPQPKPELNTEELWAQFSERLKSDPSLKGPQGDKGEKGDRGERGPPGEITEKELAAVAAAVLAQMKQDETFRGPPGPAANVDEVADAVSHALAPTIDDLVNRISALEAQTPRLDQLESQLDRVLQSHEQLAADIKKHLSTPAATAGQIIYFTAASCVQCQETDAKVRHLKERGHPITIVTLSERNAAVEGVPRLFVPESGRSVRGIAAINTFLASVVE